MKFSNCIFLAKKHVSYCKLSSIFRLFPILYEIFGLGTTINVADEAVDAGVAAAASAEAEGAAEVGLAEADRAIVRWTEEADLAAAVAVGAAMEAAGAAAATAGEALVEAGEDATTSAAAASRTTSPAATCAKFAGTPSSSLRFVRTSTSPTKMLRGGLRPRLSLTEARIRSLSRVEKYRRRAFISRREVSLITL